MNRSKRRRLRLAGLVAVMATAVLTAPSSAFASASPCSTGIYFECMSLSGTGLHVDSVYGEFWILQGQTASGTFQQQARVTKPNGNILRYWSPTSKKNCTSSQFLPAQCWRYQFTSLTNTTWPDQTQICTGTFQVYNDGSKQLASGWACATVHS